MGRGHKLRKSQNGSPLAGPWEDGKLVPAVYVDAKGNFRRSEPERVGSSLLHRLAARTWAEVTEGAGVVLVDGKEVKTDK